MPSTRRAPCSEAAEEELFNNCKSRAYTIIERSIRYFNNTILGVLQKDLLVYKTCRLVNPLAVNREFAKRTFRSDFIKSIKEVFNDQAGIYERLSSTDFEAIEAEIPRFINFVRDWVPEEIND